MTTTHVTVVGNLTADPELRFTPAGKAVASFSVAVNSRKRSADGQSWEDGPTSFYRCTAWERLGEHLAESCRKGEHVIVVGRIAERTWEQDGQKRSRFEVVATEVAASVRYGTTTFTKNTSAGRPTPAPDYDEEPF